MALPGLTTENADRFFETISPYQQLISEVLTFSDSRQTPAPWRPAADSPAMAELAEEPVYVHPGDRAPVDGAFGKAALLLLAAEDHLDSLNGMFRPPAEVSVYTPAVILRATLETLGRAHWLLDPSIGVKRRVGRSTTETLHQWFFRRQLYRGTERSEYDAEFDRDGLLAWARSMKFTVDKDRDKSPFVGEARPSSRKAIDRLFSGAAREELPGTIYRATSAVTHGSLHGILDRVEIEAGHGGAGFGNTARIETNTALVREALAVGLHGYVVVCVARRRHLGWVDPAWDEVIGRVSELMIKTFKPRPPVRGRRPSGLHVP
jgi:hypothetical protein